MDMQHRPGGKAGTFGVASAQQEAIERRERLRKLALETIDLNKDPYFMRNHLGQYECKLCLTLHPNEGNYLAHTQGKRHQQNLGRRQARDSAIAAVQPAPALPEGPRKRGIKIGRPKHRVCKQWDPERRQRSLLFEVEYPEIEEGLQPRHRFMSAYEQRLEAPHKDFQCVVAHGGWEAGAEAGGRRCLNARTAQRATTVQHHHRSSDTRACHSDPRRARTHVRTQSTHCARMPPRL